MADSPDESRVDRIVDELAKHKTASTIGNVFLPGNAARVQQEVADLAEADEADKKMLAAMPAAFADHPPLEAPGIDLAAIKAVDATFDDQAFIAVARECFYKVREARTYDATDETGGILSPKLTDELNNAIGGDVAAHRHHLLPLLDIASADILAAGVSEGHEVLTVEFHLTGEEIERDASGTVTGDTTVHAWDEHWQFERDPATNADASGADDEKHALSLGHDNWMFAHRGWVVTSMERVGAAGTAT